MPQPWLTLPKNGFGNLFAREEFQKVSIFGAESSHKRHDNRNSPGVIDIFPLNSELLAKSEIIPKPGKLAGMIRIVKHFQTLLKSALIADSSRKDVAVL